MLDTCFTWQSSEMIQKREKRSAGALSMSQLISLRSIRANVFFVWIRAQLQGTRRYQWPASDNIRYTQLLSRSLPNSCELFAFDAYDIHLGIPGDRTYGSERKTSILSHQLLIFLVTLSLRR